MLPYKGWGARLLASTDGEGAVCRPQGGTWRVVVLACPRLSEARALLEAGDLVAHVLHVGANHGGRVQLWSGVYSENRTWPPMHHFTRVHIGLQPGMHHFTCHLHYFTSDLSDFTPLREGGTAFHLPPAGNSGPHFTSDEFHYTRDPLYVPRRGALGRA